LYFISNPTQKNKNTEAYRRCWRIETARRPGCFKHLKTEGFNIKDDDKVMLLMGIVPGRRVVMTYVLSLQEAFEHGFLKQKVHRNEWDPFNSRFIFSSGH
jgi:hypothetical protein